MRIKVVFGVLFVYVSTFMKSEFMEARCYVNEDTKTIYPVCFIKLELQTAFVIGLNKKERGTNVICSSLFSDHFFVMLKAVS